MKKDFLSKGVFVVLVLFGGYHNTLQAWDEWDGNSIGVGETKQLTGTVDLTTDPRKYVNGTLYLLSGGTININNPQGLGIACTGKIIIDGGTLNLNTGGLSIAYTAGHNATLVINSGTLNCKKSIGVGYYGQGTIIINGGTFNMLDYGSISLGGSSGGSGSLIINGGTFECDAPANGISLADNPGSTGMITVNGGICRFLRGGLKPLSGHASFSLFGARAELPTSNNNFSTKINVYDGETMIIGEGDELTLGSGYTLNIPNSETIVTVLGSIVNRSEASINLSGKMYVPGLLENGTTGTAGTINVYHPGELILAGGTLENKHANSSITINTGASLYNYYGTVNVNQGTLDIKAGGLFYNVRGNHATNFMLVNGSNIIERSEVMLPDDLDIDFTWTITENAVINGQGHSLTLGTTGAFVIASGASLLFEDIILNNVSSNKIRCIDETATLSLRNATWLLDNDYSFIKGKMYIDGEWIIEGNGHTFSYESTSTSMLNTDATLHCKNVTLQYNTSATQPLTMTDATSLLHLDQATLLATTNCSFVGGSLLTSGQAILQGDSTLNLQGLDGIVVGDSLIRIGNVLL